MRVGDGRRVRDRRRVEDDQVGRPAGLDPAPPRQAEPLGRQRGHLGDRPLQRQNAALAHVPSQDARVGAVGARVRHAGAELRVAGPPAGRVGADGDPVDRHDRLDVRLEHALERHPDVEALVGEEVEGDVHRVAPQLVGELRDRPPLPVTVPRRLGDPDRRPARVGRHVLPAARALRDAAPRPHPLGRIAETRHGLVDREGEQVGRQDRRQRRRGGRVGVLVGGDVQSVAAGRLEELDRLPRAAPDRARPGLEVGDLEPRRPLLLAPGDGDRLRQGVEEAGRLVAHVGRVERTSPRHRGDERCQLPVAGVDAGGVDEAAGEADRTRVERLLEVADHGRQLLVVRRAVARPDHRAADRAVALEEGDVGTEVDRLDPREVVGEARPVERHPPAEIAHLPLDQLATGLGDRGEARPAVAGELRRHPLGEVADQRPVQEQARVGVAVRVDEAGADDPAGDLDDARHAPRVERRQVADLDDPVAAHEHVGDATGRAGAVDDGAAAEEQVEAVPRLDRGHRRRGLPGRARAARGVLRRPPGPGPRRPRSPACRPSSRRRWAPHPRRPPGSCRSPGRPACRRPWRG